MLYTVAVLIVSSIDCCIIYYIQPVQTNPSLIGMSNKQTRDIKKYKLPRFKIFEDCDDSENEEEEDNSNDSLSDLEEQYQQIMKHLQQNYLHCYS